MLHRGLVPIPTEDLKKLLALVHRGEVTCPLTPWEVARVGLQSHMEGLLGTMRGLDAAGVRAVLTAVLSERIAADERRGR